jgi:anti-sigma factor RsiW
MSACPDFERLLLERASETLTPEQSVRLEKHLATCAGCAAEDQALAETVASAKLPPLTARERISLQSMPLSALAAWHREERRSRVFRRAGLGIAAAAAVALVSVVPGLVRKAQPRNSAVQGEDPTIAALESWGAEDPIADSLADGILGGADVLDD